MFYGYEEINNNVAGQLKFDNSASEYLINNSIRDYANNNNYPKLNRVSGNYNEEANIQRLIQDQVGLFDGTIEETGMNVNGYTYQIITDDTSVHVSMQYRNSDPIYIQLDPTKFMVGAGSFTRIAYNSSTSELVIFSRLYTTQCYIATLYVGQSVVASYIDISSWYNTNLGTSIVPSGALYFAERMYLFTYSGKFAIIPNIRNIATATIVDLSSINTKFDTDVFIRSGELIGDEMWCLVRPIRGVRNSTSPTPLALVGSLLALRPDGTYYMVRTINQAFYAATNATTYGHTNEIINSPSIRYSRSANGVVFAYGFNRDINYYDATRIKAIPNICKPIVKSSGTDADPHTSYQTTTIFEINDAGDEIIAKTGTTWYKAHKPKLYQSHISEDITHYFRVRPMASSNGLRFAMCSTHLAYVAEDSYVYIIPRTAEWITDFKNAIKNGTYIKTAVSAENGTVEIFANGNMVVIGQKNPTTNIYTFHITNASGIYNQVQTAATSASFSDIVVAQSSLFIATSVSIFKVANYTSPTSTMQTLVNASDAGSVADSYQTLEFDEVLNKLITCGSQKSIGGTCIFSIDTTSGASVILYRLGAYPFWELYRNNGWTYLSGMAMFPCTYRTRDYTVLYPIRHSAVQNDQVHYGSGDVTTKYISCQSVFHKLPSITNLSTGNITAFKDICVSNAFIRNIVGTENFIAVPNLGSIYLLTENTQTSLTTETKKVVVNDREYLPFINTSASYTGKMPFAMRMLLANNPSNNLDIGLNFEYVNGVYFILTQTNIFFYSYDLEKWNIVTCDSTVSFKSGTATSDKRIAYDVTYGWLIQCNTMNSTLTLPAVLYGTNLNALLIKNLETKATSIPGVSPLGIDISSKGIYFSFLGELIYLSSLSAAPTIAITSNDAAHANHYSKIGAPQLNYLMPLNTAERRRTYSKSNKVMGFYCTPTQLQFFFREDATNNFRMLYAYKITAGHTPRFTYSLHGNFFIMLGSWNDTGASTSDTTRIIGVNSKNISSATPYVYKGAPIDATYRVVSLAYSNECAVMCAQNSAEIKATVDGVTWVTIAVIPDTAIDIRMPVGVVYNEVSNVFSVFMSDSRIFNVNPLGNSSPLIMKDIINT